MNYLITLALILCIKDSLALPRPQDEGGSGAPPAGAAGGAANSLPISWLVHALPRTGFVGFWDNLAAGIANFGNAQGSGFDAFLSGIFNAFGTLFSGVFGSGAINTAFLNYNNRPPADTGPQTPATPAKGAGGGDDDGGGDE